MAESLGCGRVRLCAGDAEPIPSASGLPPSSPPPHPPGAPGQRERGTGTELLRFIRQKEETPLSRRTPGVPVHRCAPKTPERGRDARPGGPRQSPPPTPLEAAYET